MISTLYFSYILSKVLHKFRRHFSSKPIAHKCSISSFQFIPPRPNSCLQLLVTSAPEKKNYLKPVNFPYHTQAKVTSHPREGLKNQIPHSPGTKNSQMPGVCPGVGMLKFRFDRFVISSRWKFDRYVFRCTAK